MEKSYAYIVQCNDGTFYCGWTLDLDRRLVEHNDENSKTKYTRNRRPVKLIYFEEFETRAKAAQREDQIKILSRKDKIQLIKSKHSEYEAPIVTRIPHEKPIQKI